MSTQKPTWYCLNPKCSFSDPAHEPRICPDCGDAIEPVKSSQSVMKESNDQRREGWSDILVLLGSSDAKWFLETNHGQVTGGEWRDWLETKLHEIDAAMKAEENR